MELRPGLTVEDSFLDEFATRHGIRRIALFGSALREDFGPSSDIDLLVEFPPGYTPGLLHLAHMELELQFGTPEASSGPTSRPTRFYDWP